MSASSMDTIIRCARAGVMQLVAADIDRVDPPGAAREQHFGESAGRGADIETDASARSNRGSQRK